MGHREDLLAGAKRLLGEKGYARTTARDVVAASGANLASIGYHYGSKEALLNQALIHSVREWADRLAETLAGAGRRYEATWDRVLELFAANRPLLAAQFEALAQAEHADDVRQVLSEQERPELGPPFGVDARQAALVGALHQALLTGIMAQWLVDPATALTGAEITEALDVVAGRR